MSEPQTTLCAGFFDNETFRQWCAVGLRRSVIGSSVKLHKRKAGDIIILCNKDTHRVVAIIILRNFSETDCIWRYPNPFDDPLYTRSYSSYGTYEVSCDIYLFNEQPTYEEMFQVIGHEGSSIVQAQQSGLKACSFKNDHDIKLNKLRIWVNQKIVEILVKRATSA